MANTTFSGPVRSENGCFQSITKNATTAVRSPRSQISDRRSAWPVLT
jgi:hypothetical protein